MNRKTEKRLEKNFLDGTVLLPFHQAKDDIRNADLLLYRKTGAIAIAGRGIHSHAAKAAWWDHDLFCLEVREFHGGRAVTLESQAARWPGRIDIFRANADERWPEYSRLGAVAAMRRFAGCDYGYWNVFKTALTHVPFLRLFCRPAFRNDRDEMIKKYLFPEGERPRGGEISDLFDTAWEDGAWESENFDENRRGDNEGWRYPAWGHSPYFDGFNGSIRKRRPNFHPESLDRLDAISATTSVTTPVVIPPPYCSEACSIADRLGGGVNPVELLSDRFTEPADLARSPFYRYLFTLE